MKRLIIILALVQTISFAQTQKIVLIGKYPVGDSIFPGVPLGKINIELKKKNKIAYQISWSPNEIKYYSGNIYFFEKATLSLNIVNVTTKNIIQKKDLSRSLAPFRKDIISNSPVILNVSGDIMFFYFAKFIFSYSLKFSKIISKKQFDKGIPILINSTNPLEFFLIKYDTIILLNNQLNELGKSLNVEKIRMEQDKILLIDGKLISVYEGQMFEYSLKDFPKMKPSLIQKIPSVNENRFTIQTLSNKSLLFSNTPFYNENSPYNFLQVSDGKKKELNLKGIFGLEKVDLTNIDYVEDVPGPTEDERWNIRMTYGDKRFYMIFQSENVVYLYSFEI